MIQSVDGRAYGPTRRYSPYPLAAISDQGIVASRHRGFRRPKSSTSGPVDGLVSEASVVRQPSFGGLSEPHASPAPTSQVDFPPQSDSPCGSKTPETDVADDGGAFQWLWYLLSSFFWDPIGAHSGGSSIQKTKSSLNPPIGVGGFSRSKGGRKKKGGATSRSTATPLQSAHNNLPVRVHRPYRASQGGDSLTKVVRSVYLGQIATSLTIETDNYYSFQLSDLQGYANLTAVYDSYRIRMIEVFYTPSVNISLPTSIYSNPLVFVAVDFDSAAAQTINTIVQYDTCEIHDARTSFSVAFQPRVAMAAYNGAFTGYAEGRPDQWLDCASAGTQHYGFVISQPSTTIIFDAQLHARYHLEFKRAR